jgi:hypothetical protein
MPARSRTMPSRRGYGVGELVSKVGFPHAHKESVAVEQVMVICARRFAMDAIKARI